MSDFREMLNPLGSQSDIYYWGKLVEMKCLSIDAFREKCGFPIVPAESEENPR